MSTPGHDGFQEVSEMVAARVAEGLAAPVVVLDSRGQVAATQDPGGQFLTAVRRSGAVPAGTLSVPLELDSSKGEVLIAPGAAGGTLERGLLRLVVEQAVQHALLLRQQASRQELIGELLAAVLQGRIVDEAIIRRRAGMLGLHFALAYGVLVLDAGGYLLGPLAGPGEETSDVRIRHRLQVITSYLASYQRPGRQILQVYLGGGEFAILPALGPAPDARLGAPSTPPDGSWAELPRLKDIAGELLIRLQSTISDPAAAPHVAVARYYPGLAGLPRAYREAQVVLRLGRRFLGSGHVHALDTPGLAAFVDDVPADLKRDAAAHLLAPLAGEPVLRETLAIFFAEDGEIEAVSRRLRIHRNTVRQRLERVAALTGLNARQLDDAFQIRAATLLLSAAGE